MREVDNEVRAGAAEAAVWTYAKDLGEHHDDMDAELRGELLAQNIGDLLGNLMHLCDAEGFDFSELLERGRGYHAEEVWEEQQYNEEAGRVDRGAPSAACRVANDSD